MSRVRLVVAAVAAVWCREERAGSQERKRASDHATVAATLASAPPELLVELNGMGKPGWLE